jgi:16S rRNA (cytidine1402-2'-O)-methyltransferase
MPTLYVVATPIGNLEDISLRALRMLRTVNLIAAEDTRKTKRLLNAYNIETHITSYHEHSKETKLNHILKQLQEGDVALVSEAGMPGISDPGYELVVAAQEKGISVVVIPGPSAIITALAVSGLPTDRFMYIGFLPRKFGERQRTLQSIVNETGSIVIFETPHRLQKALTDLLFVFGDRRVAICRQLTKLHEEIFHGTVSQAQQYFKGPRGEFTLVIEGKRNEEKPQITSNVSKQLNNLKASGATAKEATTRMALETGLSKRELYRAWLKLH